MHLGRWLRALRHALNRTTMYDAIEMLPEMQQMAQEYPLVTLSSEDAMAAALRLYVPSADLFRLVAGATAHIGDNWEDDSGVHYIAIDRVLDAVAWWAREDGIHLTFTEAGLDKAMALKPEIRWTLCDVDGLQQIQAEDMGSGWDGDAIALARAEAAAGDPQAIEAVQLHDRDAGAIAGREEKHHG